MRPIRLWHFSLALLLLAALLVGDLAVKSKLGWAWDALRLYADGGTTSTVERSLERQAVGILQRGGSVIEARELLERALAIDPNSSAVHVLGDAYLREGNLDAARRQFEHYLTIDPAFLPTYLRLIEVYEALELPDERRRVIAEGIDYFADNVDAYTPQPDDDVHANFNDKAYGVHNAYRESLHLLRQFQEGG